MERQPHKLEQSALIHLDAMLKHVFETQQAEPLPDNIEDDGEWVPVIYDEEDKPEVDKK